MLHIKVTSSSSTRRMDAFGESKISVSRLVMMLCGDGMTTREQNEHVHVMDMHRDVRAICLNSHAGPLYPFLFVFTDHFNTELSSLTATENNNHARPCASHTFAQATENFDGQDCLILAPFDNIMAWLFAAYECSIFVPFGEFSVAISAIVFASEIDRPFEHCVDGSIVERRANVWYVRYIRSSNREEC